MEGELLVGTSGRNVARRFQVLSVVQGNVNVDELMTQLLQTVEMFSQQQRIEMAEEEEREARESVKREQDEAYQASLEADR